MAGAAVTTDVLKCQLKPIDAADYSVRFSREERVRLGELFPNGICDWTQPGVEQLPLLGTWLRVETT